MNQWIMHTEDGFFYPIKPTPQCRPEDHGKINDHVVKITTVSGKVLWRRVVH